jgi:hypothetical protein
MTDKNKNNVLLDPSLIVAASSLENTIKYFSELKDGDISFSIPESFDKLVKSRDFNVEHPIYKFSLLNAKPSRLEDIYGFVEEYSHLIGFFKPSDSQLEKYNDYFRELSELRVYPFEFYDMNIAGLLYEEFIFLQENSYVVSRIKKPFAKLIDAGAVCIQYGRNVTDRLIRTTVRKDEEIITNVDRLRSLGKWIAVGGDVLLPYFEPHIALTKLGVLLLTNFFLLYDP